MLRTEPSFSIYSSGDGAVNREEEIIAGLGSPHFSFGRNSSMSQIKEDDENDDKEDISSDLKGLGIEDEAISKNPFAADLRIDGGGEGYFEKTVKEDPSNPSFLRNYGIFLQSKGDFHGAEDYYYRAARADPEDGKALLLLAKLMLDCHHDKLRASRYFKKATNAAPEDSEILAAYAKFLWDVDEDQEESSEEDEQIEDKGGQVDIRKLAFAEETRPASPPLHLATGLGIDVPGFGGSVDISNYMATDFDDASNMEEYYKMMAEGNPTNPLYLSSYAQFLYQVKGDLRSAEEYYSRAIVADPSNGEVLSQYAQLILDLNGDTHRASSYFDQAVRAAPNDSNVLAAYARFLWEAKDDDEEQNTVSEDRDHDPVAQGSVTDANAER